MALVIRASSFAASQSLKVLPDGVRFSDGAPLSTAKRFGFGQIDLVLMSPDNTLSFQVGREVFSIATQPYKDKHRQAIEALVNGVRATAGGLTGPSPGPTGP